MAEPILLPDGEPARHAARDIRATVEGVIRLLTGDLTGPIESLVAPSRIATERRHMGDRRHMGERRRA